MAVVRWWHRCEDSLMARITVISDTHVRSIGELPAGTRRAISEAEMIVHCGDFTGISVVEALQAMPVPFFGVYGNSDPGEVRARLPHEAVLDVEGHRIAVAHPRWGGHPDGMERELIAAYPEADAIVFGHTHEPMVSHVGRTLLLNPGQAYASFMVPASHAILTADADGLLGEVMEPG